MSGSLHTDLPQFKFFKVGYAIANLPYKSDRTEQQFQEVCELAVAISKKCKTRLRWAKLTTSQQQLD